MMTKFGIDYEVMDVREAHGCLSLTILAKAADLTADLGLCVVQSIEPHPLYRALDEMGLHYVTDRIAKDEFRVYINQVAEGAKEP